MNVINPKPVVRCIDGSPKRPNRKRINELRVGSLFQDKSCPRAVGALFFGVERVSVIWDAVRRKYAREIRHSGTAIEPSVDDVFNGLGRPSQITTNAVDLDAVITVVLRLNE